MKKIVGMIVPHKKQRYDTAGDYYIKNGRIIITASKMKKWQHEAPILIHEMIEFVLIKNNGITIKEIEDFDHKWNKERAKGLHKDNEEPGFDKRCPYRKEHVFANKIEKMLVKELGMKWKTYDNAVLSLSKKKK